MSSQTMQASLRLVVSRPLALRRACVSHHCAACWKAKCGVSFIAVTPRPGRPCGQTCIGRRDSKGWKPRMRTQACTPQPSQ